MTVESIASGTSASLLLGGRIHSPSHPDATAMAVRDGLVVWVGSDAVGRERFPQAEVDDLDGGFVTPGFVDSHVHITETGLCRTGLDLRPATSSRHCLQLIADYAAAHPGQPIWGHGWDESGWPDGAPDSAAVDAVVGDRVAYLSRVDVHSALASTALRRRVTGLSGDAVLSGPLSGEAHHRVRAAARELLTADQRSAARTAALDAAAAAGIVMVHECAGPDIGGLDDWRELRALSHGVEVVGYWGEPVDSAARARGWSPTPVLAASVVTCSSTAPWVRTPPGCTSPTPMRPIAPACATSTRQPSRRTCGPAPRRRFPRAST